MTASIPIKVPIAIALACCFAIASTPSFSDEPSGFEPLFDGKSLSGWVGDPSHWRVEAGRMVGEIPHGQTLGRNTWLVWQAGKVADFDLRLQVRLTGAAAANSGIQFRCQVDDYDHVSGYQADLDQGATWLGRIYDEHGRALLVERGSRVSIAADGKRHVETFAPADQYAVLFRENDWNDYRIVATGEQISVYVNGTLFSQLVDAQTDAKDLLGSLAFQLHAGPETKVEFRNVMLKTLGKDQTHAVTFTDSTAELSVDEGIYPKGPDGNELNLGFEDGTLKDWTATGTAFQGQPLSEDGISGRWSGQTSNKQGDYFIGGFEIVKDAGIGQLVSIPFQVTHPYASFLIGGGDSQATRVDIVLAASDVAEQQILFSASGRLREQMQRVAVDLRQVQGKQIFVRVVDESSGGWGHLNFDDFRLHDKRPPESQIAQWRSTRNPLLHHLVGQPAAVGKSDAENTISQMYLPAGFSADVIAAEPLLHQPMAFTFDAKGRLWVVEGHSYPQKRAEGEGLDRVLIFADQDGDGSFESRKVFCDGLNLVSGLEVGFGGVWIGAAPQLLFIPDRDGDDIPDAEPEVLLDGFGYADTHETINSLIWGPDGWLYGNQGVFNSSNVGPPGSPDAGRISLHAGVWRYHPDRRVFEVFAHGGSNQWGLDYDDFGQFFMTHCRSYWGKGPTTHVIQGGNYWNQVNSGYAPFISNSAALQNYQLASARYGHGEGGAGKRGSRAVYGGHSHVGTMLYLGDNWPIEYRNHLFTHNLHGHQMNHQVNSREFGGYNTVHAGQDMLFCADQQYIGVDLKYGPDGAVYISDWYDPRHCHSPNTEQWDRGNGRIYRIKYDANFRAVAVDMTEYTDHELVDAQLHRNDWYVRTARRVLQERSINGSLDRQTVEQLTTLALEHEDPARRLRSLWAVHAVDGLNPGVVEQLLNDPSEYVRAWTVQLAIESDYDHQKLSRQLLDLADRDQSLLVRRYLAAAIQRVDEELGWQLAAILSQQSENAADRDLTLLIWYGVAKLMPANVDRAFTLARESSLDSLRDSIHWYATRISNDGRSRVTKLLLDSQGTDRQRILQLFREGVGGTRGLDAPEGWARLTSELYRSPDGRIRSAAESLGAAFGDQDLFDRLRSVMSDSSSSVGQRSHAIELLSSDDSPKNLPIFLVALDSPELRADVIPLLARYKSDAVASELLARLQSLSAEESAAAMNVLTSRAEWSRRLLDEIAAGTLEKNCLTAYFARQIANLGNDELNARLQRDWGAIGSSSGQQLDEIETLTEAYSGAPLWAYSVANGQQHFTKLCVACHQPQDQTKRIGPKLDGTGTKGIRYAVENVIDPNAVIGRDFQARSVLMLDGRVISGLVQQETENAITLRTATETIVIANDDIERIVVSKNSFMPEGLLQTLNDRERIELFKYLMSL